MLKESIVDQPSFKMGEQTVFVRARMAKDESGSESGWSESESNVQDDRPEEGLQPQGSTEERILAFNRNYMDNQMSKWRIHELPLLHANGNPIKVIQSPTASKLDEKSLNPYLYRFLEPIGSLNELAQELGAPEDWELEFNRVYAISSLSKAFTRFRNLENTSEAVVQSRFTNLIGQLTGHLNLDIDSECETKVIVGGILAHPEYDVRSSTDPNFVNASSGERVFSSEIKPVFEGGWMWYFKSRGVQTFCTLYAFNCPCFLFSPGMWKLFMENKERSKVMTFPFGTNARESGETEEYTSYRNSTHMAPMGKEFLQAVTICLLSERGRKPYLQGSPPKTPAKTIATAKENTPAREYVPSDGSRDQSSAVSGSRKRAVTDPVVPKFISGINDDGTPIWTTIRVVPETVVQKVELELEKLEREENAQKPEDTLSRAQESSATLLNDL